MSATTGQSMFVWLERMDPPHTLCLWTNYSWSTTTFSSGLFYTYSKTKGKKFTFVLQFNNNPHTSRIKAFSSSYRLGIWLFMSEMPYGTLSSSMLWRVLYVMQCAETAGLETISTTCDTRSCVQALRGKRRRQTKPCFALAI